MLESTQHSRNIMNNENQSTLHAIADGIFIIDMNANIIFFNKAAEQLTGWESKEILGNRCNKIFHAHIDGDECDLKMSLSDGEIIINRAVFANHKNGDPLPISLSSAPLMDAEGAIVGGIQTFRNNTKNLLNSQIVSSVAEGVFTIDKNWNITSFNQAAEHITGWNYQEVLGKSCREVFHSSICGENCLLQSSIQQQASYIDQTIFIKNKQGDSIPVAISASPLLDNQGRVIGGIETFRDVTQAIRNQLILDSVADGVFTVDKDWLVTSFNHAAEQITGWTKKEVLGKPCSEIFHSSVCGENCLLQSSIKKGTKHIDQAIFIKNKDGDSIPVSVSSSPLLDDQGNIIGGIETFRDNTFSIRKSLILDSIADGVFTVDRNWHITSFNRAAEEITGWSKNDAMGKSCSEIFHSSICGKNCAIAESLYSGAPVANRSITIQNHQGDRIPISISAAPLTDPDGNIIGGVETFRDLTTITSLRKQLSQKYTFDEIISKAVSMQRLFKIMPEIARSPSTALILGESGTGKELVARALYNASERSDKPFIIVNCGALPETLLESELFGYKAGAFTDARKDKKGRFAAAEGGTLFLDEIGEIPGSVQVKLLRVLQEKVYEPLGSNTPVKADVRIITATNRDLQAQVNKGEFREDLFYRLNVVKINLPPLRERKEDIPLLVDHFVKKYSAQQGKDIVGISAPALSILMRYDYPGNIRELENIIEYSFILCEGGYIQPEHLPEPFAPGSIEEGAASSTGNGPQSLEQVEHQAVEMALERNKWKKMATCRELGISKDTLRRKIKKYGINNPAEL